MGEVTETSSAMEMLKCQLEALSTDEISENGRMLDQLKKKLADTANEDIRKNSIELRVLATKLVEMEKKDFSLLKILGIEENEFVHSNALAWLLDPLGSHGLGSHFVEKFLSEVALRANNIDVLHIDFSKLLIDKEIPGDESRLDLRIRNPSGSFFCIIENKILSGEGAHQTNRLYKDFHGSAHNELFVFLTLDKAAKPKDANFTSLAYEDIVPMLKNLLTDVPNPDAKFLIRNYISTLERLIMSEKFESFSKRTELYYQYQKYIDDVSRAFNNDRELLLSTLEKEIQRRSWWDDKSWRIERTGTDVSVWKISWAPSKDRGVYFQLYLGKSQPTFYFDIYGWPTEFSANFGPVLKRILDKEHPEKLASGFTKNFGKGVNRFIEKSLPLSVGEKGEVGKILSNLDSIVALFEKILDKCFEEFKNTNSLRKNSSEK